MAAGSYERKSFAGGAPQRTLVGPITNTDTTVIIDNATGWPDAATDPFVIAFGLGTPTEEKALVSARSGTTLTIETRGYDDTVGLEHSNGTTVDHVLDASTVDQANRLANLMDAAGQLIAHNGTNPVGVPEASQDGEVLQSDTGETAGVKWDVLETVLFAASAPSPSGPVRLWFDEVQDLLRPSDGSDWLLPSSAYTWASVAARTAGLAAPTSGTISLIVSATSFVIEIYGDGGWRPLGVPSFAGTTQRDAYFGDASVDLLDGAVAYVEAAEAMTQYRESASEWFQSTRKVTVSDTPPSDPVNGDLWFTEV